MDKEWTSVVPLDKELRAYLRWRWLVNGWVWDPLTGKKRKANDDETEQAKNGGVIVETDEGDKVTIAEKETEVSEDKITGDV